jgi:hypothetical protein
MTNIFHSFSSQSIFSYSTISLKKILIKISTQKNSHKLFHTNFLIIRKKGNNHTRMNKNYGNLKKKENFKFTFSSALILIKINKFPNNFGKTNLYKIVDSMTFTGNKNLHLCRHKDRKKSEKQKRNFVF